MYTRAFRSYHVSRHVMLPGNASDRRRCWSVKDTSVVGKKKKKYPSMDLCAAWKKHLHCRNVSLQSVRRNQQPPCIYFPVKKRKINLY